MALRQIVGIIGRDHCGSTMLARLLASVPGCGAPGELHHLVDVPPKHDGKQVTCWKCGPSCSIFDGKRPDIYNGLNDENLYSRVAAAMGCEILVSTDKWVHHYRRFVKPKQMDGIVLYKEPGAQLVSDLGHYSHLSVEESLNLWVVLNGQILDWAPEFCNRCLVVSYHRLVSDVQRGVATICDALGIDAPVTPFRMESAYHHIYGNPAAHEMTDVVPDERHVRGSREVAEGAVAGRSDLADLLARLDAAAVI